MRTRRYVCVIDVKIALAWGSGASLFLLYRTLCPLPSRSIYRSLSCVKRLTPVPSTTRHCCLQHSNIAMATLIFGLGSLYLARDLWNNCRDFDFFFLDSVWIPGCYDCCCYFSMFIKDSVLLGILLYFIGQHVTLHLICLSNVSCAVLSTFL